MLVMIKTSMEEIKAQEQEMDIEDWSKTGILLPQALPVIPHEYGQTKKASIDENYDICLRIATIDNPTVNRISPIGLNPHDTTNAVNENVGKVCLRFEGLGSGILNIGGEGKSDNGNVSYNAEDRTLNEMGNTSTRETVDLTYPFLWSGPTNWCGINYLPPVGAKVIVGFAKNNRPMILGYLNENYKMCYPPLRPGEILTKGFGNNYIHNRWSNKLDLKAWSTNGSQDIDDPAYEKCSTQDYTLWIRMDADNGHIVISANSTSLLMTPDNISMTVGGTSVFSVTNDSISLTTGTLSINAQSIDNNGAAVHHN
jgi:hypothetical protein